MSPGEQLEALRSARVWPHRAWWAPALAGLSLGLGAAGLVLQSWVPTALAVLAVTLAWALSRVRPYRAQAVAAAHGGGRAMGRVHLARAERNGVAVWRATVLVDMLSEWSFEFVPRHWTPPEGTFMAEICFAPAVAWPALVLTEQGLLYPDSPPQRRIPR